MVQTVCTGAKHGERIFQSTKELGLQNLVIISLTSKKSLTKSLKMAEIMVSK